LESRLGSGVGNIAWESPHRALLAVVEQLRDDGVPLADKMSELIVASADLDDIAVLPRAVADLLSESMTGAESVGTLMLATLAAQARDSRVDDASLLKVMAVAALLVARFETYLAERSAYPAS
jgi:hypothetical protein